MSQPRGPTIVPNLPNQVGPFNNELVPQDVADDILSIIESDRFHTTTSLWQTLHPHYIDLIKTKLETEMSRDAHPSTRSMNSTEASFALRVLSIIKGGLEHIKTIPFKYDNLNAAVEFLRADYTAGLETAKALERTTPQQPLASRLLLSIDRLLNLIE
jgi:hypothetical protein